MTNIATLIFAVLGGILPALVWLAFWLREDYKHPEPKGLILRTFLFGMVAVVLVLPFQKAVDSIFPGVTILAIMLWVVLEEVFKLTAAYIGGLRSTEDNEPIDPIIYTITAALGFVALENALFIFGPLASEEFTQGIITGNLRFVGASLLHVVSSGIVGVSIAFSFYKSKKTHLMFALFALIVAIAFHTGFNFAIVEWGNIGALGAFVAVWLGIIFLLWAFEKAKKIAR